MAWVRTDRVAEVAQAVDRRFEREGFAAPQHLVATPYGGAGWVRLDG